MPSPKRYPTTTLQQRACALLLHGSAAAVMAYGWFSMHGTPLDDWINSQKGGHFQFLTIQGLMVAWGTTVIGIGCDLVPSFAALKTVKRKLFMIAMPLSIVISTIYWSLYLFAPGLILQTVPSKSEPSSSNFTPEPFRLRLSTDLALHAIPAISMFADFKLFEQKYGARDARLYAPLMALGAAVWYGCWVEWLATYNGIFPYPFLTENPSPIRVAIYAGATSIALVSFWVINALHTRPWLGSASPYPLQANGAKAKST